MKRILRLINTPAPMWLVAVLVAGTASAATSLYVGSLKVPTGANITDVNATASSCVGTTNTKVYTYGANCVIGVSASGNIASSGGANPNITFTGTLPIANGGTGATTLTGASLAPVYNASGSLITASTLHEVEDTTSITVTTNCSASTWCSITGSPTFSGSSVFSSQSSYVCKLEDTVNQSNLMWFIKATSGTATSVSLYNGKAGSLLAQSISVAYLCVGT